MNHGFTNESYKALIMALERIGLGDLLDTLPSDMLCRLAYSREVMNAIRDLQDEGILAKEFALTRYIG